jgi:hypothetical protein
MTKKESGPRRVLCQCRRQYRQELKLELELELNKLMGNTGN